MSPTRLILASRSPRRAQLLSDAGYLFEQAHPPFDDDASPPQAAANDPEAATIDLARRKAASLQESTPDPREEDNGTTDRLILSADTVVVDRHGSAIGAPVTADEARTMIGRLIGCRHRVVTGVALLPCRPGDGQEPVCFADAASVDVGAVTERQLADYLATDKWQGKAGGYNLFDRQAEGWPITVDGDPTTVVGLPMAKLAQYLDKLPGTPEAGEQ